MFLKKCLSASLAFSIAMGPMGPLAQAASSEDPITLLLQSLKTDDPAQAKKLLDQVRDSIRAEKLPEDRQKRIDLLLDQALKRIETRKPKPNSSDEKPNPSGGTGSSSFAGTGPISFDSGASDAQLESLLRENPDVRNSMWELGQGRLSRDASNVGDIVKNRTGRTPEEHDTIERDQLNELNQPGQMIGALKRAGLIRANYAAENRALKEQFRGASLETLADHLITRSLSNSLVAGMTKTILSEMGKASGATIKGVPVAGLSAFAGISAEAMATFVINANLTLQLADLYGIRLNSFEEEVAVLTVFALAKIGIRHGLRSPAVQELIAKTGKGVATSLVRGAKAGYGFITNLMNHPTVAQTLKQSPLSEAAVAHEPDDASKPSKMKAALAKAGRFGLYALKIAASTGWSVAETYAVGEVSKRMFGAARQRERAMMNDLFRQFLMSTSGEGFFKLMILSMSIGKSSPSNVDIKQIGDLNVQIILNLARSARICSPQDMDLWSKAVSLQEKSGLSIDERRLLQYACDSNLSQGRYVRLSTEFQTFNEIPQEYVAKLRIASRESRLRMGELLLQMQFLDGDRSPAEVKHFEEVISKYLGFTSPEDLEYFDQLQSFVIENGGMKSSPMSPSGFTISDQSKPNPYDLSVGYTATAGPEAPSKSQNGSTTSTRDDGSTDSSGTIVGTTPGSGSRSFGTSRGF